MFLLFIVSALLSGLAGAQEVSVAVASNFAAPMERIADEYQKGTGHRVRLSSGSSGKFYAQIRNGAPFEIFLSADEEHPRKLLEEGRADSSSRFTYAVGKLVLWSPKPGVVDSEGDVLRYGDFKYFSMANPELAPYGAAARSVLGKSGLWEKLRTRAVFGESIAQAYQFAATRNAELGFVALSQIRHGDQFSGSYWVVPQNLYPPLKQDAVLLSAGAGNPAAHALLEFLQSARAKAIIREFGYTNAADAY